MSSSEMTKNMRGVRECTCLLMSEYVYGDATPPSLFTPQGLALMSAALRVCSRLAAVAPRGACTRLAAARFSSEANDKLHDDVNMLGTFVSSVFFTSSFPPFCGCVYVSLGAPWNYRLGFGKEDRKE
jgi:hypothetical protein